MNSSMRYIQAGIVTMWNRLKIVSIMHMVDYISRVNDIPLCEDYSEIRKLKLKKLLYPSSVITAYAVSQNKEVKERAIKDSIPEFIHFNIVESEVRNVI